MKTLDTLALMLWGLGVLIALERETKPFQTKVEQGYRPTSEASDLTARALAESRKRRYSYTALGSLTLAMGLTAYALSLAAALKGLELSHIFTGAGALLPTTGIGCGLIAYGDTERDLQRKLATAERRYFLPQNSPLPRYQGRHLPLAPPSPSLPVSSPPYSPTVSLPSGST